MMIKEKNNRNLQRKKGKKSDGRCSCKVLFSLFVVVKILSFMMIQPPFPAFNILLQFNPSFQHFSIQFLVQKKSFESVPRTWARSFPRQNSLPSRQIFKWEYLELLISKSSDSKAQNYLHVQDYNFDERVEVR